MRPSPVLHHCPSPIDQRAFPPRPTARFRGRSLARFPPRDLGVLRALLKESAPPRLRIDCRSAIIREFHPQPATDAPTTPCQICTSDRRPLPAPHPALTFPPQSRLLRSIAPNTSPRVCKTLGRDGTSRGRYRLCQATGHPAKSKRGSRSL